MFRAMAVRGKMSMYYITDGKLYLGNRFLDVLMFPNSPYFRFSPLFSYYSGQGIRRIGIACTTVIHFVCQLCHAAGED